MKAFLDALGDAGVRLDPETLQRYNTEQRGRYKGQAPAVLLPHTTEEVARCVTLARAHDYALVPIAGNTGLVGGAVATSPKQLLLSLERMNRIRALDALNFSIEVEAGATLKSVQDAAQSVNLAFPLGLAVADTAQVGGVLSTNAGGIHVMRYGNARAFVLGLEVVLADGQIFRELRPLRKNNQGVDVKQLFLGSEGTLGIITAASLQLTAPPLTRSTVLLEAETLEAIIEQFASLRRRYGSSLVAAELLSRDGLHLVEVHKGLCTGGPIAPWSLLCELETESADALDEKRASVLWECRRALPWAQRDAGASLKHDIALPLSRLAAFHKEASRAIAALLPKARPIIFGHLGDGNLHYNIQQPDGMPREAFLALRDSMADAVHALAHAHGGTFSAEHGIGLAKKEELHRYGDPVGLDVRRLLKQTFDPEGILNPGKGVDAHHPSGGL